MRKKIRVWKINQEATFCNAALERKRKEISARKAKKGHYERGLSTERASSTNLNSVQTL